MVVFLVVGWRWELSPEDPVAFAYPLDSAFVILDADIWDETQDAEFVVDVCWEG